jgi:predicted transcriptional regulator
MDSTDGHRSTGTHERSGERGTTSADWNLVGYVVSSKYRVAVLRRLTASPATPSRIADDVDAAVTHVSRALGEFRDRGLAQLLVDEERKKGRIYAVSDRGRAVWSLIDAKDIVR